MRHYSKCSATIWTGKNGKVLRKLGTDVLLIANYLVNNPHDNMLGVYYLPIGYISVDTGMSYEQAAQAVNALCQIGFCYYDDEEEYIWVTEMVHSQVGENLKANDNRIKCVQDIYDTLPHLVFLEQFCQKYQQSFHLKPDNRQQVQENIAISEATPPLEDPSKGLRSQKQKQYQEQKQNQKQKQEEKEIYGKSDESEPPGQQPEDVSITTIVAPQVQPCDLMSTEKVKVLLKTSKPPPVQSSNAVSDVELVFSHWQAVMNHSHAKLDKKRKRVINEALKMGYDAVQLCDAISGCAKTPFNMGENERGQRYDSLQLILRDADHIDRFIQNHVKPPQAKALNPVRQNNLRVMEKMLEKDEATATDPEHLRNIELAKSWVEKRKSR